MNLHDIKFLKALAAAASNSESVTSNPTWKKAYLDLHSGAALLWRLLERSTVELPDKPNEQQENRG